MLNLFLTLASFLPQGPGTSAAPVCINEFCYDDSSTDNYEFVELYNRSSVPVDISLWKVVVRDPGSPTFGGAGTDPTQTIPAGTILQPGAFYLLGNTPGIVAAPVVGFSQTLPVNALENGGTYTVVDPESIELQDANGVIIDSLVYEQGLSTAPFGPHPIEVGFYGDLAVGDDTVLPQSSISRAVDGLDNDSNPTDFMVGTAPTPGLPNLAAGSLPLFDDFDLGSAGVAIPGWIGGFVKPRYVDPTVIDSQNLSSKPASPQGGLAMSTWDVSGGGNAVSYDLPPVSDVVVETYAWFEPTMTPFNPAPYSPTVPAVQVGLYNLADGEAWALGVRGSCAANGNPPNANGTYFTDIAQGVGPRHHHMTGIAWIHYRTTSYSNLYLVDLKDGATNANPANWTVLAGPIAIVPGVTDGWQRLRLHVQGDQVVANFGGTYGFDDGQRFHATTTTGTMGRVYISYREAVLYNNNGTAGCRPPLFDAFDVHTPSTFVTNFGTGSPTTVNTPQIASIGLPIVGTTGWRIGASNLVPQGAPNSFFCGLLLGFSAFPAGYPVPNAPATVRGYLLPILASQIGFADANGNTSWLFALPQDNSLLGFSIVSQIADFDPFLPAIVPIGTSGGMDAVIGR